MNSIITILRLELQHPATVSVDEVAREDVGEYLPGEGAGLVRYRVIPGFIWLKPNQLHSFEI